MTTLEEKVRYATAQRQTRRHTCHWPSCGAVVPPAMWGCKYHWKKIPKRFRDKIWATFQPGQEDPGSPVRVSREYLDVADEVQLWIAAAIVGKTT